MSASFRAVGWNRTKLVYDAVLLASVALYLLAYMRLAQRLRPAELLLDEGSLAIRAYGSCAFLLLTVALAIGPLARLDSRFLPLLYNRRHLGVITCVVAGAHFWAVIDWYLAFSPLNPWVALLVTDASLDPRAVPFAPLGLIAFVILLALAATSHDFWLSFLGPALWKALHMSIYAAYALVVAHVAFGALQDARSLALPLLVGGSAALLVGLHLAAAWSERRRARDAAVPVAPDGWVRVGPVERIAEGRGVAVALPDGGLAAVFRSGDTVSAVSNRCAHQAGPLAEGRVRDGKIICPWHGYEYCLRNGRAPAPFTERIPTFRLRLNGGAVELDPTPLAPGTDVEPLRIAMERSR